MKPNETIENMIELKSSDIKNKDEIRKISIIEKEKKQEGEITLRTWIKFFNYGFGVFGVLLIALLAWIWGSSNILINYFVGIWLNGSQTEDRSYVFFNIFWSLIVILFIAATLMSISIYGNLLMSSTRIHNKILWKILRAPATFFDANPIGSILTRF